jgi:microcystin-dependent protein
MSTEPFVGEVKLLGFYFPPLGYMTCQGQLLSIAQNTALFSLMGNYYGGDGRVTFGLPDLQGRIPVGQGTGAGLPTYDMGETGGTTNTTLLTSNLPPHVHTLNAFHIQQKASTGNADGQSPEGAYAATASTTIYTDAPQPGIYTGRGIMSGTTDIAGSSMPMSILNPFLCMNYSIAIEGIFPSRN